MTATAVALLSPCIGFTFGITIPGSVGMGQQIAQITMFSGSGLRAVVLAIVLAIFIFVKLPTPPGDEEEAANASAEKVSFGSMHKRPYFA